MAAKYKPCLVFTTAADQAEASRIGEALLQQSLAACVQYEAVRSQYIWHGELCSSDEIRLTIKTARHLYRAVEKTIRSLHSYDCPQIIMQPLAGGSKAYLAWAKALLRR